MIGRVGRLLAGRSLARIHVRVHQPALMALLNEVQQCKKELESARVFRLLTEFYLEYTSQASAAVIGWLDANASCDQPIDPSRQRDGYYWCVRFRVLQPC